ncbi:phosphotransferase family protein [Kineococcus sp. G2]|uniref:phosphotransferase family protein n=1 Tax=Kineococcus sp. G2 TaxID=3127484 RepID=UPI00301E3C38
MSALDAVDAVDAVHAVERELLAAEPALPALALALDDTALRSWAAAHGVDLPPAARVDRLRHKAGTSVRVAVDPGDGGPWWLLHGYCADAAGKAAKDVRHARGTGPAVLDERLRAALVPAFADRDLPGLREPRAAGSRTLAHNPGRRAVLRRGDVLLKVHATGGTAARAVAAAGLLRAAGTRTPATALRGERTAEQAVAAGTPFEAGSAAGAVEHLLRRWSRAGTGTLPVLGPTGIDTAVRDVLRSPGPLPPAARDRVRALGPRWEVAVREHAPALAPRVLCHGDLSPDQLLRGPDGEPTVLDLDRAARGPAGWDAASWRAACTALGVPPGDVPAPHPLLLAAAALLRLPEPFRRRRPGWTAATADLAALASAALDELTGREEPC